MLPEQFDKNKGLLNLRNGILNLARRELVPHDRARYITRMAQVDYDPAAKAPVWEAFIQSVTGGDAQLAEYLQVMVGYCLCGSTREQCMFFLYGDGANGKSTFLETLAKMLGDYCMNAQADTIASTRSRSSGALRHTGRGRSGRNAGRRPCEADDRRQHHHRPLPVWQGI